MTKIYDLIRPIMVRGDVQNFETVSTNAKVVEEAIALEEKKYAATGIMGHFYGALAGMMDEAARRKPVARVLDVGSATGEVIAKVAAQRPQWRFLSVDIMAEAIDYAANRYKDIPNVRFQRIDFIDDELDEKPDLTLCLQTLEHIEDGYIDRFLLRLFEVTAKAVIVSVPREPFWCLANLARLHYWPRLGNSPHHVQHWRKASFKRQVLRAARAAWGDDVEVVEKSPLWLWTILLVVKKNG